MENFLSCEHSTIGTALLTLSTLLGAYLLVLRIRDYWSESPDPKLTYATIKQLELTQHRIQQNENHNQKQIQALRLETKKDLQLRDNRSDDALEVLRELITRNAQSIAALTAKAHINDQRFTELNSKSDQILQKLLNHNHTHTVN